MIAGPRDQFEKKKKNETSVPRFLLSLMDGLAFVSVSDGSRTQILFLIMHVSSIKFEIIGVCRAQKMSWPSPSGTSMDHSHRKSNLFETPSDFIG